jgi:hypothetical protein
LFDRLAHVGLIIFDDSHKIFFGATTWVDNLSWVCIAPWTSTLLRKYRQSYNFGTTPISFSFSFFDNHLQQYAPSPGSK